jgi:hypothetical protein
MVWACSSALASLARALVKSRLTHGMLSFHGWLAKYIVTVVSVDCERVPIALLASSFLAGSGAVSGRESRQRRRHAQAWAMVYEWPIEVKTIY